MNEDVTDGDLLEREAHALEQIFNDAAADYSPELEWFAMGLDSETMEQSFVLEAEGYIDGAGLEALRNVGRKIVGIEAYQKPPEDEIYCQISIPVRGSVPDVDQAPSVDDRHIAVATWDDIDAAPEVSGRDKQHVATIFTEESWDYVVWLPDWLLEEKDVETRGSTNLLVGDLEDYSERAWRIEQRFRDDMDPTAFLPKSRAVVFERVRGVETIETP